MFVLLRLCLVCTIKLEQDKTVRMKEKDTNSELSFGQNNDEYIFVDFCGTGDVARRFGVC